jgi:hypothetical protein
MSLTAGRSAGMDGISLSGVSSAMSRSIPPHQESGEYQKDYRASAVGVE